jgi:hypothetical protein
MKSRSLITSILRLVVFAALVLLGATKRADAIPCLPGPDWVDNCPSGTDQFFSQAQHGTVVFDPEDGGLVVPLPTMTGITRVFRGDPIGPNPFQIETEMVELTLMGGGLTLRAGDGTGNLQNDGPLFSPGRITELGTGVGSTSAHSFFDIFFEISPTPFGPLHNATPGNPPGNQNACRMTADIDRVPPLPGTEYTGCHDPQTSTDTTDGALVPVDFITRRVGFGAVPGHYACQRMPASC